MPARLQKEVKLKVTMSVLGRRRTKTWHQGTILDIKTTGKTPQVIHVRKRSSTLQFIALSSTVEKYSSLISVCF